MYTLKQNSGVRITLRKGLGTSDSSHTWYPEDKGDDRATD